jgi:hypothetical protein
MAGYSGTPLPKKLGIKPGSHVALLGAPDGLMDALRDGDGADASFAPSLAGRSPFDVLLLFTTSAADLRKRFPAAAKRLDHAGGLWVSWPKRTSCVPTDLTEDRIREIGLAAGLVDNKVCAIDDTWSGLRFVYRLKDRPKEKAS